VSWSQSLFPLPIVTSTGEVFIDPFHSSRNPVYSGPTNSRGESPRSYSFNQSKPPVFGSQRVDSLDLLCSKILHLIVQSRTGVLSSWPFLCLWIRNMAETWAQVNKLSLFPAFSRRWLLLVTAWDIALPQCCTLQVLGPQLRSPQLYGAPSSRPHVL